MTVNGLIMWVVCGVAFYAVAPFEANAFFTFISSPSGSVLNLILSSLFGTILTGLIIGSTSSSIGKYVFGIRITDQNDLPIGATKGLARDFEVWVKGNGLGVPIIALVTQIVAFRALKHTGNCSWDQGRYKVTYRRNGPRQYIFNSVGIVLWIVALLISVVLNAR